MKTFTRTIIFLWLAAVSGVSAEPLRQFFEGCIDEYIFEMECENLLYGKDDRKNNFLNLSKVNIAYNRFREEYLRHFDRVGLEEIESIIRMTPMAGSVGDYELHESSAAIRKYHGPEGDVVVFRMTDNGWLLDVDESVMVKFNTDDWADIPAIGGLYALAIEWLPDYYSSIALNLDISLVVAGLWYEKMPEGNIEKYALDTMLKRSGKTPENIRKDALDAFERLDLYKN